MLIVVAGGQAQSPFTQTAEATVKGGIQLKGIVTLDVEGKRLRNDL